MDSHDAPTPSLSASRDARAERHGVRAEMWQRRILSPEANDWSRQDMELLRRIRNAEALGAFEFLKGRLKTLKGLAVEYKLRGPSSLRLRLTKEGYDRYLFLKSQEALQYFNSKGVDIKWAYFLKDINGRSVFGENGLLTEEGDVLYTRVVNGKPAYWKTAGGEVLGNRPPRRP